MPQPSLLRTTLLATPLTMADALACLDSADMPESTKAAVRSTAISAVRQALRVGNALPSKEDVLNADIRAILPILHVTATEYARAENHRQPNEHAARAHRFVELLTGRRFSSPRLDYPCPDTWQALIQSAARNNANGELGYLARCCMLAGVQDAPRLLPTYEQLVSAADTMGTSGRKRLRSALALYRSARRRLLERTPADQRPLVEARFAPMSHGQSARTTHLGTVPVVHTALRALGFAPEAMTPDEMLRVLAPGLAADFDYWSTKGPGNLQSASYISQCWATLLRLAGWAARAGHLESLRRMKNLLALFVLGERAPGEVELNERLADALGEDADGSTIEVSLLEHLVEQEAAASLRRSTVIATQGRDAQGRAWITSALWSNCSRLWDMTQGVYRSMSGQSAKHAATWALVESRWARLQGQLSARQVPAERRVKAKNKLMLVRAVTLPQLVCVGLPMRRREIYELRQRWQAAVDAARAAGHVPEQHPAVREAARLYFDAAVPFTALALATDDGLRRKQYTRGRLGDHANFRITLERDAEGRPVGVASLTTWWSGDRNDPAHLKIRERNGVLIRRENRHVRRGYVDRTILWDIISWWRPMQLVAAGVVPSLEVYDLGADLKTGQFALFPSRFARVAQSRPERSRTDIGDIVGRELHYITRSFLRPELPAWDEVDDSWRSLWAIHALRLLTASFWGGVRGRWSVATDLTMDNEATLRAEYTALDKRMEDLRGNDPSHWEHPDAYNEWMDRLFTRNEDFDPLLDRMLPLPPHLANLARVGGGATASKPKVRAARLGQRRPSPASMIGARVSV